MAVRIITDSTSDISLKQQEEYDIEVVPLLVRFGQEEYLDGVTLTGEEFYEKLSASAQLPTTAQVSPEQFVKVFQKYGDEDEIVGIFLSSAMSGTYQSAVIAKNLLGRTNIHLVDSRNVTFALGLLVLEASRMRNDGCSAQRICEEVTALIDRVRLYAVVDTLKYLKMGGRLAPSAALVGAVLRIKPIITIKDGMVDVAEKKQGTKAALEAVAQHFMQDQPDSRHLIVFGDSIAPESTERLKKLLSGQYKPRNSRTMALGATVGTHAGPGCAGVAYIVPK